MQDHHQQEHQADREQLRLEFDYANPATLGTREEAPDSDPTHYDISGNSIRCIGRLTGTRDGNTSSVILPILLIKFIAAVWHSSASSRK
jgi:hypothetical protein